MARRKRHTSTKKQDPEDPNKYRIVNLIDVCNKILSQILTARCYKLLKKYGTQYHFEAMPNSGCQDGNFTLKNILHLRQQHNLETYIIFADIMKAFDTVNHKLIIKVLQKYGAPPKFCDVIKRLYTDIIVTLQIGKEKAEIPQAVGVRQGDNLSPVLFLFLMSAFAKTLEAEWKAAGISTAEFKRVPLSNINHLMSDGKLTSHNRNNLDSGTLFEIMQILYVDDGAFFFNTREEMIRGLELIRKVFARLGLEMHLGSDGKASKTEAMYIPTAPFYTITRTATLPQASSININI